MALSAAFVTVLTALKFLCAISEVLSVARGLADGPLDTLPTNDILPESYITRYNLSDAQIADVERRIANYSKGCFEAPVRAQMDFLYAMMVFTETASMSPVLPGIPGVRLFTPDTSDGVTLSTLFRTSLNYSGRGDIWIADPTTGPCKGGSCGGAAVLRALAHVSTDDLQDLPTSLDDAANPPSLLPGSEQLPKPQLLMYYRYDIFSSRGWSLPATWADLAIWAEAVNGTVDADGDGAADWALCLDTLPACKSGFLVMAMMASAVQPATPYGTFFEPATMEPLVSTVAFELTLELFKRLARFSPPSGPDSTACRAYEAGFSAGKCLLTISFDQMRATPAAAATATVSSGGGTTADIGTNSSGSGGGGGGGSDGSSGGGGDSAAWGLNRGVLPAGSLGVAPLPGSEVLLDRRMRGMVGCEVPYGTGADRCPNAVNTTCYVKGDIGAWRRCRVNRAPLLASLSYDLAEDTAVLPASGGAQARLLLLRLQINATALRWARALAGTMSMYGNMSGAAVAGSRRRLSQSGDGPADVTPAAVAAEGVGVGLGAGAGVSTAAGGWRRRRAVSNGGAEERRLQQQRPVSVEDWTHPAPLALLGYSETEVSRYLAAYWGSLLGGDPTGSPTPGPHNNVVHELQIRGSSHFTYIYSQALCWTLQGNVTASGAAHWATAETRALQQMVAANLTRLSYKYSRDIGWRGNDLTGGSSGGSGGGGRGDGLSAGQLTAAIMVPLGVAFFVVIAAALVVVSVLRRWRWRYKTGEPPGPGLGTTLILTDIQNSTVLWETLPADTMDGAIRCHHEVLRGLLPGHKGYESATEGDAFILAFHAAEDAARYAIVAQEKLLAAPWPAEMLSHTDCEVVWMMPQRTDPTACLSYVNRELSRAVHSATGCLTPQPGAEARPSGPCRESHPPGSASWLRRLSYSCAGGGCGGGRRAAGAARGCSGLSSSATWDEGREGLQEQGSGSLGRHGGGGGGVTLGLSVDVAATATIGKLGESPHGGHVDGEGRTKQADSYRTGKPKVNLTVRTPSETAAGGVGGGGGPKSPGSGGADGRRGGSLERLASKGPLARLSPLGKCPSDIHSYMTDNETDADVSSMLLPSMQLPTKPIRDSAPDVRMYDSNDVPLPAGHAALMRAATAGGGGGAVAAASMLHRTSGGALGGGGGGGTTSGATMMSFNMGANNTAVTTLTEALRQGWRRCPGPAAAAAAAAAGTGASSFKPGMASVDTTESGAGASGGSGGSGGSVEPLLAFRGMRVRMGLHTGADLSEVSLNKATSRTQYSGTFMTVAKAVCDAAHGGQVVLSSATFRRLPPGCLAKSAFLMHMGEHVVLEGCPTEQEAAEALYQLLPYSLSCRLAAFPPLRTLKYVRLGLPDAPVGRVTVAFMYVIGAQTLLAWNPLVAGDALSIFQDIVSAQLSGTDGYLVELVDGLCLTAFRSAADALLWSLRCGRLLLTAPWSDELLEHELCEEVSLLLHGEWAGGGSAAGDTLAPSRQTTRTFSHQTAGGLQSVPSSGAAEEGPGSGGGRPSSPPHPRSHPPPPLQPQQRAFTLSRAMALRHKMLMRGLRLKVGMDIGFVADSINATTGRMAYRGRPMNRAARIASKALAGQVHCSAAVWRAAAERLSVMARVEGGEDVTASSLGLQSLKGVMEKIEVMSVSYKGSALPAEEAATASRRGYRNSIGGGTGGSSTPAVLSGIVSAFSLGHACSHSSPTGAAAAAAACIPMAGSMPAAGASCRASLSIAAGSPTTQTSYRRSGNDIGGSLPATSFVDRITPNRRSFLPSFPSLGAAAICRSPGRSTNSYCGVPESGGGGSGFGVDVSPALSPKKSHLSDNGGVNTLTTTGVGGLRAGTPSSSPPASSKRGTGGIVAPATVSAAAAKALASAKTPSRTGRSSSPATPIAGDRDHIVLHLNPLHASEGMHDWPSRPWEPPTGNNSSDNGNGNAAALLESRKSTTSAVDNDTEGGGSGAGGRDTTRLPPSKASPELHAAAVRSTSATSRPSSASRGSPRFPESSLDRALGRRARSGDDEERHLPSPSPGFAAAATNGGGLDGGNGSGDLQRIPTLSRRGDGFSCIGLLPLLPPPSPSEPLTRLTLGVGVGVEVEVEALRGLKGEAPTGAAAVLDFGVRSASASKLVLKRRATAGA